MIIKQVSVVIDEQTYSLAKMMKTLADRSIEIMGMTVHKSNDFTIVRLLANNILWTSSALWEVGFTANPSDAVAIALTNEPDGMSKVLDVLEKTGNSIKYMYMINSTKFHVHIAVMSLEDNEAAVSALEAAGIRTIGQNELSSL